MRPRSRGIARSRSCATLFADRGFPRITTPDAPPRIPPEPVDEIPSRDLGFGARIADNSRKRLLNPDGTFNVRRAGVRGTRSLAPYHALLAMGWGRFLLIFATFYVVVNAIFALAYMACGPGALVGQAFTGHAPLLDNFLRAFFFSVETFGTVGYGNITPTSVVANGIVTAEAFTGLVSAALATGLIFARFSRPNAAIVYSRRALIAPFRGGKAFMFRCANERSNQLIEVSVRIIYTRVVVRATGERIREFTSLPLEYDRITFFALSWTVVHPIDERSPLANVSPEDLVANDAEFLVLLSGTDETFAQIVHSRRSYKPQEIVWNARFVPMFVESREGGTTGMDLTRIHDFERIIPAPVANPAVL